MNWIKSLMDRWLGGGADSEDPEMTIPRDWTVAELKQLRGAAPAFAIDLDARRAVWKPSPRPRALPVEAEARAAAEAQPMNEEVVAVWSAMSATFAAEHDAELAHMTAVLERAGT